MIPGIKHIILADDDPDDVELFQIALTEVNPSAELAIVGNGCTLLELLDKAPLPDLIVLDLNMPCKSGRECLIEIRANKKFHVIPIFILTTSTNANDSNKCMNGGANHYFVKPSRFTDLKRLVNQICEYTSPRSQPNLV